MKRFFIVLAVVSTMCIGATDAQQMQKGMSLFNVGLGLVPGWGLNASYDYGLVDTWGPGIFTVGGFVGFSNWGTTHHLFGIVESYSYRITQFLFAPRATYRYAINESFEVFGTAFLGVYFTRDSYKDYNNDRNGVYFGTTAGCRYSFSKNISVFAEIGYNITLVNGGLSFSF